MALPLGLFYPSVGASTERLGDTSLFWKRPREINIRQVLTRKKRSVDSTGSLSSTYRRVHLETPLESNWSRRIESKHVPIVHDQIVTPKSLCTSFDLSSPPSSSCPSLSGITWPSSKSLRLYLYRNSHPLPSSYFLISVDLSTLPLRYEARAAWLAELTPWIPKHRHLLHRV